MLPFSTPFFSSKEKSTASASCSSATASTAVTGTAVALCVTPTSIVEIKTKAALEAMGVIPTGGTSPQKFARVKPCHILPQDQLAHLREPLHIVDKSPSTRRERSLSLVLEENHRSSKYRMHPLNERHGSLASDRVARDQLMNKMEELILKEAELRSAFEFFDYSRQKFVQEHEEMVCKVAHYEQILLQMQTKANEQQEKNHLESNVFFWNAKQNEKLKWQQLQEMVCVVLPDLLKRLEEKMEFNTEKIETIHEKMEQIRRDRLRIREEIVTKEEEIAFALLQEAYPT
jgi:hypothetical protein